MQPLVQGANWDLRFEGDVAWCRIWKHQEAATADAAEHLSELAAMLREHVLVPDAPCGGHVLDLRLAPTVLGPAGIEAVQEVLAASCQSGRPTAVLVGSSSLQAMQWRRLAQERGCGLVLVAPDEDAARAWVVQHFASLEPR
jgi:hypothetical protein